MNRRDYFVKALNSRACSLTHWVVSCFSIYDESPELWKTNPYPYRLVMTRTSTLYVNPENMNELLPIEDAPIGEALFKFKEPLTLLKGELPNVLDDVQTTYGNAFVNAFTIVPAFGAKLPFVTGRISPQHLEATIIRKLKDDPPEGQPKSDDFFYVSESKVFASRMLKLDAFPQLCVPTETRRSVTADPRRFELRAQLYKKYEGQLHDPVVQAAIEKELLDQDAEWLKGDASEGFLISSKAKKVVRKKLFLTQGQEAGVGETKLISKSLSEGWDPRDFVSINNTMRGGSFSRGQETMLGGVIVKKIYRAGSTLQITSKDCGSRLGKPVAITEKNFNNLLGFSFVTKDGSEVLTEDAKSTYLGTVRMRRSPGFCRNDKTDYCELCCGPKLALHPTGLATATANVGSTIMGIFMGAMHGKILSTVMWDPATQLS